MITEKEINQLAKLSNLRVNDEETAKLKHELESIIAFAEVVRNIKTEESSYKPETFRCHLREDKAAESYPREEILSNASVKKDGYILLRKSE